MTMQSTKPTKKLRRYNYILALDPSGSYYEGKGTTGYCLFDTIRQRFVFCGSIYAKDFSDMEAYWNGVIELVYATARTHKKLIVVCEDYLLYAARIQSQINSRMETPKLIGCLQWFCYMHNIPYHMQTASEVKNRWSNDILVYKNYIRPYGRGYKPTSGNIDTYTHHSLDAIRHAVHFNTFKNEV